MEARAIKKFLRSSPRKMRLVIDLIRGKNAADAMNILKFTPKLAARDAERVLNSALGNLDYKMNELGESYNDMDVYVKEATVDQGPTLKRIQPAPMGRAYRIRKRSNHLKIVVATKD